MDIKKGSGGTLPIELSNRQVHNLNHFLCYTKKKFLKKQNY